MEIRYNGMDAETHAEIVVSTARDRIKITEKPEAEIKAAALSAIKAAYAAGLAMGRARAEHALASVVAHRVREATATVRLELPHCPHCAGAGCSECHDTGKYQG